eukprot:TRINITY_DN22849_c0_g1_i11.p1 TRINITY_DN22849_c0_g1~~TRINITY_DN22849_c0_g1_i11.p1  ORF type:complete len:480 (+),score=78.43 TRINITY_DN22849_c0_g1_i11:52-1491(+)
MEVETNGYWSRLRPLVKDVQSQVLGVVRHAERADAAFAFFKGQRWTRTQDCEQWPLDPPLSDAGEVGALEAAEVVNGFAESLDSAIDVVVTSPYLRCVQTAAVMCAKLGPETKLIIDASVGEIFGPHVFGDREPRDHRRPLQSLLDECELRGVEVVIPEIIGTEPSWPETLSSGRQRFAESFLIHQERSCRDCRNLVIVTHGDCVASAAALFPSTAHVSAVEPGGMLLASRRAKKSSVLWLSSLTSRSKWQRSAANRQITLEDITCDMDTSVSSRHLPSVAASKFMGGWSVDSFLLRFREPYRPQTNPDKVIRRTARRLARLTSLPVNLSADSIHQLLDSFLDSSRGCRPEAHELRSAEAPCESIAGITFQVSEEAQEDCHDFPGRSVTASTSITMVEELFDDVEDDDSNSQGTDLSHPLQSRGSTTSSLTGTSTILPAPSPSAQMLPLQPRNSSASLPTDIPIILSSPLWQWRTKTFE